MGTGAAQLPRPIWCLAGSRRRLLVEDFDVDIVDARVGKPYVLGRGGGEIQLPTTRVRPTVGHGHDHGSITVAYQQLRTERQVRRSRRVLAVGLEDVPTRRQVTLQPRSVPAGQLGVGQGVVLECGQRYGESASHQEHLEKRLQESPSRSLAQQAQHLTALQPRYKRLHISFGVYWWTHYIDDEEHILRCQRGLLATYGGSYAWRAGRGFRVRAGVYCSSSERL